MGDDKKGEGTPTSAKSRRRAALPRPVPPQGRGRKVTSRGSPAWFRALVENAVSVYAVVDAEGRVLYESPSAERAYGWKPEELLGTDILRLVHPDDMEYAKHRFSDLLANLGVTKTAELRYRHRDGSWRIIEVSGVNLIHDPEVRGILLTSHDVTEHRQAEESLRQCGERYQSLFQNSPFPLCEFDCSALKERIDGLRKAGIENLSAYSEQNPELTAECAAAMKVVNANGAMLELHKAATREQLQENMLCLWTEKTYAAFRRGMLAFAKGETKFEQETVVRTVEGEMRHKVFRCSLAPGCETSWARVLVSTVDVTEHKETQELRRSEARLRQLAESIPQVFWMSGPGVSEMIYVSPAYEELWGRTRESVYRNPLSWLDGVHPDDRERVRNGVAERRRQHHEEVYRVVRPDGTVRTVRDRVFPIRDEHGRVYRLAGIVDDITEQRQAEQQLHLLMSAIEQSTEGIGVSSLDGNILFVNNVFAAMHGYSPNELVGRHRSIFHTPKETPAVEAAGRQVREQGEFTGEIWHLKRDGTVFPGFMHNSLIRGGDGKPIAVLATLRDITHVKRAEEDLCAAKESLQELVSRSPALIYRSKVSGKFGTTFISENVSSVLGYDPEEFTGQPDFWADHVHPEDRARVLSELQHVFEAGYHVHEYRFRHKDGRYHWLHDEMRLIRDAAGSPMHIIGYCLDITDRKEADEALRASEEKYRTLVDQSIEGIVIAQGLPPRLVFANQALGRMTGYSVEELTSLSREEIEGLVHPEDREMFFGRFAKRLAGETVPAHYEVRVVRKDGASRWAEISSTRIEYRGQPAVQAMFIDITDRKQAEDALRKSEEQYRSTIDGLDDIIHVVDSNLRMILLNAAAERWAKRVCPGKDAVGRSLSEVFSFLPDAVRREYERVFKEGRTLLTEEVTFIGGNRYVTETRKIPVFEEGKITRVITVVHDITERKRMEEALRESEERYRTLFESIGDGIIVSRPDGQILAANPAAARMAGCSSAEELKRMKTTDFYAQSGQREWLFAQLRERGSISNVELTAKKLDGSEGVFFVTFTAHYDKEGNITQVDGIFRDMTEKRKMEEELLNARRIESLGVLAAGIAHDFNNILTAATANLFLSRAHAMGDRELLEHLIGAEKAIVLAKRLTHQLLTFSKGGAPMVETASLTEILMEAVDFALSGSAVRCEFSVSEFLWPVKVDVAQVSQAINNLVLNAVQAMPEGGAIRICAENVAPEDRRPAPLGRGRYVKVSIQDTGIGIPREHFGKIFDPYFTTKPGGSGLGLATAYTVIRKHSGHIAFESEPDVGSTFYIYLPASEEPLPERREHPEMPPTGAGRILLMDDEEQVRQATSEVLRKLGYDVDVVSEGGQAVEEYAAAGKSGHPYDAVILDLTVAGGMGGKEAILRLLEMDPHVKALCASGYANDPIMADYESYGFQGVITKPYRGEELAEKLHQMIERSGE